MQNNEKAIQSGKLKPILSFKKFEGIQCVQKRFHKDSITKLQILKDLNCIYSSSLDGFIHVHDIETLKPRKNKTFS